MTDTGMRHEVGRARALRSGVRHPVVEPTDLLIQVLIQRLQLIAAMGGMGWQRQRREHRLAISFQQRVSPLHAVTQAIACKAFCTRVRRRTHW